MNLHLRRLARGRRQQLRPRELARTQESWRCHQLTFSWNPKRRRHLAGDGVFIRTAQAGPRAGELEVSPMLSPPELAESEEPDAGTNHASVVRRPGYSRPGFSAQGAFAAAPIFRVFFPCRPCAGSRTCNVLEISMSLKNPLFPKARFQRPW